MESDNSHQKDKLRALPSIDRLLINCDNELQRYGHNAVTGALRDVLNDSREQIIAGSAPKTDEVAIKKAVLQKLQEHNAPSLRRVFNLTGTVLHTNLGRAILPQESVAAIHTAATEYSNVEFDLESGRRGDRDNHVEGLLCELTGAEAATAVNNNAAAVLLVLNTLAMNREVPVSRGELVEIGGSFRIPEVMQRANCTLVEVGATNRTHLHDYSAAINDQTALLMKVHTSNYKIEGFTSDVSETELASLAHEHRLPFVMDLGSGCLIDFSRFGLPAEPTAADILRQGADIITFSGDKLLGGPQCGLIAGRADLIRKIKSNPLKRALRLDKMTLAGTAEVLKLYRNPANLHERLPTLKFLTRSKEDCRIQAERLAPAIQSAIGEKYMVESRNSEAQVGSGSLPVKTIPSVAIGIRSAIGGDDKSRVLSAAFRELPVPVLGHVNKGCLLFDLRCLDDEEGFVSQLKSLHL